MKRKKLNGEQPIGQDSFMDVIANLVGILIILVMVVGAQAKSNWVKAARSEVQSEKLKSLRTAFESAQQKVSKMLADNRQLEWRLIAEKSAESQLREERDQIQLVAAALENEVASLKEKASGASRATAEAQLQALSLETELNRLKLVLSAPSESEETEASIEHYPTPMAQTVFGDEIHLRLNKGRLAIVPMAELINLAKSDFPLKARTMQKENQRIETLGPVDGFCIRYTLQKVFVEQRTSGNAYAQQAVTVSRFDLIPDYDDIGTPLHQSLQEGSDLQRAIARLDPAKTTISVWVYPDSYSEFRELKRLLAGKGFLVAAWPLPSGRLIGGSPQGYHSAAQ